MLNINKKWCLLAILLISHFNRSDNCSSDDGCSAMSNNLWQPHAFSNYASREILVMKGLDVDKEKKDWVSRFGLTSEYMQNFRNLCTGLGALPFWSGTNTMTIGDNSGEFDIDTYQFGMGDVKKIDGVVQSGTISLSPTIQQMGTELLWWLQQHDDKPGVYFKLKVPLGAMRVTNKLCEQPATLTGENVYTGLNNRVLIAPPAFYPTLSDAFAGGIETQDPLFAYGRISCCTNTAVRFGDLTLVLGGNFVANENGHAGIGFKVSCPTGNVPTAQYVLEPIFGRAGHWGAGAEFYGHYKKYTNSDDSRYWTFWVQAELMHLFSGRRPSWRSFDLKANGPGSKYLMVQHYIYGGNTTLTTPSHLHPAINITTMPVFSTFEMEGNCAMMFDYHWDNFNIGLAGEFWGRTKESLAIDVCKAHQDRDNRLEDFELNNYAVVGRQIGQIGTNAPTWCEPLARINKSQDRFFGTTDAPKGIVDATLAENRIPSDFDEALDICGAAAPRVFTGKLLGELGYTWSDRKSVPHVSLFGAVELAGSDERAANLWSVGVQGSLQF
ncbi:hypothetical protein HYV11_00675 [Candidatus Dependentiae bacterium]|nr:hypothetical protein [Candidatus Dependentiae bacterium]